MFALGVRSVLNRSINNELRSSFRLIHYAKIMYNTKYKPT
jgi:hypothetical protein